MLNLPGTLKRMPFLALKIIILQDEFNRVVDFT